MYAMAVTGGGLTLKMLDRIPVASDGMQNPDMEMRDHGKSHARVLYLDRKSVPQQTRTILLFHSSIHDTLVVHATLDSLPWFVARLSA